MPLFALGPYSSVTKGWTCALHFSQDLLEVGEDHTISYWHCWVLLWLVRSAGGMCVTGALRDPF